MLLDWLRTDEHVSVVYGHADLMDIPWTGGRAQDTQKFLGVWDNVLDNLTEGLSEKVKRGLLYRRMLLSSALKEDVSHFRREKAKGEGAENYTYAFLRLSIERFIANDRQDKNLADRQHALRQAASGKAVAGLAANQAAPAQKSKETDKGKGHQS